ncbi:hypothetical protein [Geothrix sp. 21YS21S-2]|uniref:hypothetical protein n=1 Tax=Geothrix sp. 21YS21S-2 TaxID=3068893 RepID=UPI0027B9072F|nr:hypothetical protein [Geothrix sp. 21YS21S-2]
MKTNRPSLTWCLVETAYGLPVEIGSRPIPQKYVGRHEQLPFWKERGGFQLAAPLMAEAVEIKRAYN